MRENAREFLNICTVARYQGCGNLQLDCYNDYVQQHRHIDWTLFCDTDEILVGNIRDAVAEFGGNYNCLSFSPILHGCNGKIYDDGGGMFERFGGDIIDPSHHWYKFVARTADIVQIPSPHCNVMRDKQLKYLTAANYPQCTLHHFRFRSFEEYLIKFKRGRANDNKVWQPQIKNFFELNNIQRTRPEVVSLMKKYGVTISTIQVHYERRDTN